MRVGLLTPELTEAHGWGRYSIDLGRALAAQGVELVIAASRLSPGDAGLPHHGYYPVLPGLVPARRWITPRSLRAAPTLRAAFRGCDAIHAVAEPYLPLAAVVAGKRPLFVTAHGTYLPRGVRRRGIGPLFRRAARRCTVLPVSTYTAQTVAAALPGVRQRVIPNGVHVDRFAAAPPDLPATTGPTVLGVGVSKARKGFHVLLEAMALVRRQVPDAACVIVGSDRDAVYRQQLDSIIAGRGLGDSARLLGRVPDDELLGWYHAADVFALPAINIDGKFEGFGLVYLEAGAAGLPVVGTTGCGAEDAVDDGETGLLVPQNDPDALAAALVRLLGDPDLRRRMGEAGRRKAAANSWAHVAAAVREAYEQALTGA